MSVGSRITPILLLSAYSRISNRPMLVLTGRIGAQFNVWTYRVPFSMFVPLMTPLFIEPFITCPYFDICVAMNWSLTSHGASLVVTFVAFLINLTDLFYKEISKLRILYFACSLFRVTIQDFYVIWIDFISSKYTSFSNSVKISSCLIPVNNLLLKCSDKCLFIFSILPWMLLISRKMPLLVYS